nr:hypothetical protein [Tanacetum cinerariifolium]
MAPVTRQGQNPPPSNTNTPPHHMTPESVQGMIDQALLRNSTNGDGSQSSHEDNPRHVKTTRPCFYADFIKCHPLNFKGNEGVVGLTQWIEKMESIFNISGCAIKNQEVLKKIMTNKYCPQGELKKLEIELWNLKVKENQEKDKIESKLDKKGKRGEARKSQKQLQLKEEEKLKKTKKNGQKRMHGLKVIKLLKKRRNKRAKCAFPPNYNYRDQSCQVPHTCTPKDEP